MSIVEHKFQAPENAHVVLRVEECTDVTQYLRDGKIVGELRLNLSDSTDFDITSERSKIAEMTLTQLTADLDHVPIETIEDNLESVVREVIAHLFRTRQ